MPFSLPKLVFSAMMITTLISFSSFSLAQKPVNRTRPPQAERITDHTYRIGSLIVDTKERTVLCPGEINLNEGAIEYLAVAPGGKTHESLLLLKTRPLHLQVALLMLGLEPKNVLKRQGDPATPQGDPVELRIRWKDKNGQALERATEEMISELPNLKGMPVHPWLFTGSRILKEGFEADLSKSLIAVYHDPAAILDNPLPGAVNNNYAINSKRTPKQGTRIELIFKAHVKKR